MAKDGTGFPVEFWSRLLHRNHRVIGMVVTFVDVTVRKQAEEAMRNAKEAAEAGSRAKSEFLANMSRMIRLSEQGTAFHQRIIAPTAHAMSGKRGWMAILRNR